MTQRVTDLREPPVVGRFYLVPTVIYPWLSLQPQPIPVFPTLHEDSRFFKFADLHFHADPRFLSHTLWKRADNWSGFRTALATCQAVPVSRRDTGGDGIVPHPRIVWRRMTCKRLDVEYRHGGTREVASIRDAYAGQQCRKLRSGWQCPHQRWPMGSLAPDVDGIITCPLHGLKVRASDGVVV
jgi:hypothetical protein